MNKVAHFDQRLYKNICCLKYEFLLIKKIILAAQKNNFAVQSNKFAAHFTNSRIQYIERIPK
jgi:hypothetical protein